MTQIVWDSVGQRFYETGLEKGVLYPASGGAYPLGVPWNGLISVTEKPSGAEADAQYADNIKYLNLVSMEEFGATIEAFTYPDEFLPCDGQSVLLDGGVVVGQQSRSSFGLCYQTKVGNDVDGEEHAYKLHLVYGCLATPSERSHKTVNDSPEAINFSWEINTTPEAVSSHRPTSLLIIDSRDADAAKLILLEEALFGTATEDPYLPHANAVITLMTPDP